MELYVILLILLSFVFAFFSGSLAVQKNRNETAWFFLGLLFSIIALIAIAGSPVAPPFKRKIAKPKPKPVDSNDEYIDPYPRE